MKNLLIALCMVLLIVGCKSKSKTVEKVPEAPVSKYVKIDLAEVDAAQKKKAYDLGKRVLMTCNTSKFKAFTSSEATPKVIQNTTQARLTSTCHKFRLKYGDFKDLTLVEVFQAKNNSTIYRYKAHYQKKIANKELRVTMDENDRISSLKSADWVDNYQPN